MESSPTQNSPIKNTTDQGPPPESDTVELSFPWFSAFFSLLLIALLVIISNPELVNFYHFPVFLLSTQTLISLIVLCGISYMLDIRHFMRKRKRYQHRINNLRQQLETVWESKKKQQQRANINSDHADKLKYFISEKLLETIEYDEKYLHFKGIAAEVRHNGVISYDKIITALNTALEQHQHDPQKVARYQSAVDAVRYLWDLLDLSTAENMGLHIGNLLIENEEHYYQLNLDGDSKFAMTQSIPLMPTFSPQLAVLMTLDILLDETEIKHRITRLKAEKLLVDETFIFTNEQFRIELFPTPELLGNPNHVILLLENIIKNAQFFQQKVKYKQKTDRIAIRLFPGDGYAHFTIYNRGPQIRVEELADIFKLGFSTRRTNQHHGKGLGLYFASEIVKGYNGQIRVNAIQNIEKLYYLKVHLKKGAPLNIELASHYRDNRMKLVEKTGETQPEETNENWNNEYVLNSNDTITAIEISTNDNEAFVSEPIEQNTPFLWLEPNKWLQPGWLIEVKTIKRKHQLLFKALDISGVCFEIKLPTALSRLNEQDVIFDDE